MTEDQKKQLIRFAEFADTEGLAVLKYLKELEERVAQIMAIKKGDKGEPGEDYVLTKSDKEQIAEMIEVPVVEKEVRVIEKTEVVKEQPIIHEVTNVTEVVKEVAVAETAQQIKDKLESLKDEDRLDKSAIKGLKEWLESLEKQINAIPRNGGGGVMGRDLIKRYDLSDQLNGVTKTFNIPGNWLVLDVRSSSSPLAFRYGVDWTNTDSTITFTSEIEASATLAAGQTVYIIYVSA